MSRHGVIARFANPSRDHDATGLPKTKIEVHDPIKPLVTLAKIRCLLRERDVTPPAPPNQVVLIGQLSLLPKNVLEALNAHLEDKARKAVSEAGRG